MVKRGRQGLRKPQDHEIHKIYEDHKNPEDHEVLILKRTIRFTRPRLKQSREKFFDKYFQKRTRDFGSYRSYTLTPQEDSNLKGTNST